MNRFKTKNVVRLINTINQYSEEPKKDRIGTISSCMPNSVPDNRTLYLVKIFNSSASVFCFENEMELLPAKDYPEYYL